MDSSEKLEVDTDKFSDENFIGKFQFGKLYRGKIKQDGREGRDVMVKLYEDPIIYKIRHPQDSRWNAAMEGCMLEWFDYIYPNHPAFIKEIGFYNRETATTVYDFKPLDTVYNLLLKGSFTWLQRIKVALHFSSLLECLQESWDGACLVCNVSAAHIMLDQDNNVKLIDYGMVCGGKLPGRRNEFEGIFGCYGCIDPTFSTIGCAWSEKVDVFAFGVLLLELIAKRVYDPEKDRENANVPLVHEWAWKEYKLNTSMMGYGWSKRSLVHQSLEVDADFHFSDGHKITKLAMSCVSYCPQKRPTMRKVVDSLLDLHVVRHNADLLGIEQLVRGRDPELDKLERYEEKKYHVRRSIRRSRLWQVVESAKDHLHYMCSKPVIGSCITRTKCSVLQRSRTW